ncbi:phosphatidylcholine and lysophosphatidylcholine phospholipase [Gonapodya sp. JEL0774]|nr:phosphatidylcholine and lysophosphatidylcholine phospholipase [Gonapodya sp. JEL0774]
MTGNAHTDIAVVPTPRTWEDATSTPDLLMDEAVERALGNILGFLEREVFELVAQAVQRRRLDPGEVLFSPTVTFRHTAILISGRVNISCIESGELHLLHEVKPGRVITSLFTIINELANGQLASKTNDRFTRPAKIQAVATDPTVVAVIPEGFFALLLESHQAAATQILSLFVSRVCKITIPFIHRYLEYSKELLNIVHASDVIAPEDLAYAKFCAVLHSNSPSVDQHSHFHSSSVDVSTAEKATVQRACLTLMASSLGLSTAQLPRHAANAVELHSFDTGYELVKENFLFEGLFLVLDGTLEAVSTPKRPGQQIISFWELGRGSLAGALSAIIFQPSPVCWRAKTPVRLAFIRNSVYLKVADSNPILLRNLMRQFLVNIDFNTLAFDYATEWRHCTPADEVFKVVSGRIRMSISSGSQRASKYPTRNLSEGVEGSDFQKLDDEVRQSSSLYSSYISPLSKRTVTMLPTVKEPTTSDLSRMDGPSTLLTSEKGVGETLGELPVLIDGDYDETCTALRDTHIATLPRTFIHTMVNLFPQMAKAISCIIAENVRDSRSAGMENEDRSGTCHIIGIIPIYKKVPIKDFATKLSEGFASEGADASILSETDGAELIGSTQFNANSSELRLQAWLLNKEYRGEYVLMLADGAPQSSWTKQCVKQSDIIFFVALGDNGRSELGEFENVLHPSSLAVRKVLVLLHKAKNVIPGSTKEFLVKRKWIARHLHVQLESLADNYETSSVLSDPPIAFPLSRLQTKLGRMFTRLETLNVSNKSTKLWDVSGGHKSRIPLSSNRRSDFSRLARMMMNKSIGLVFGGGGAKGAAHVGVLRALESHEIVVDFIGGTSMGACVGAIYATSGSIEEVDAKLRCIFAKFNSVIGYLLDLTLPFVGIFRGKGVNDAIKGAFGSQIQIEDFWLPFFCNVIDVTKLQSRYLYEGMAWRCVRASMSLMGIMPPVSDGDGCLLMDGGYHDNVPARAMTAFGAAHVIAVDVAGQFDTRPVERDSVQISGWVALFAKPKDKKTYMPIPSLLDLQNRIMFFAQQQQINNLKTMHNGEEDPASMHLDASILYIRPPLDAYNSLNFSCYDEIVPVGEQEASTLLSEWKQSKECVAILGIHAEPTSKEPTNPNCAA